MINHTPWRLRAPFLAAIAGLLLAFAVSTASANNLSFSNQSMRIVWSALRFITGSNTDTCHVTLEGSFHRGTTTKTIGTLIGYITRAAVNTCTGGSATILTATLPWHIQYAGFTGTLPNISSLLFNLIGLSFAVQPEGSLRCLARTEVNHPAKGRPTIEGGVVTELNALVEAEIPLTGEAEFCRFAGEGHFEGNASITVLSTTTRITVRLI